MELSSSKDSATDSPIPGKARKGQTHEKILESCSKLLRKKGIQAASVADVMQDAGLTVGGFYAHFDSKEAMVAEGFRHAVRQTQDNRRSALPPGLGAGPKLQAFLKGYLSPQHRDKDREGQGCPLAALAVEMGRGTPALRKVFAEECQKVAFESTNLFSDETLRLGRKEFLGMLSTYVGGLILARATRGSLISEEILAACRGALATSRGEESHS